MALRGKTLLIKQFIVPKLMFKPIRETLEAGMPNIVNDPIVSREKIIFPPTPYQAWLDETVREGIEY